LGKNHTLLNEPTFISRRGRIRRKSSISKFCVREIIRYKGKEGAFPDTMN
jgi:hypothetical protein